MAERYKKSIRMMNRASVWACLALSSVPCSVFGENEVQLFAVDGAVIADVNQAADAKGEDPLDLLNIRPGFMLPLADEVTQKQTMQFREYLAKADWGKAFRLLGELNQDQREPMVPINADGLHASVTVQLQRQLLELKPDGLQAFRLYFDGQAREQLEAIRNHPLPGSEDQLSHLQQMVDRLMPSSFGGEAAIMAGDLYFKRGAFGQAERNWRLALEHGSVSGQGAFELQAKRIIALHRAGDTAGAAELYAGLKARYGQATIQVGGEDVDAMAMLDKVIGEADTVRDDGTLANAQPLQLPKRDAMPIWHLTYLDPSNLARINNSRSNNYYRGPQDLVKLVPNVVADEDRVYFSWIDAVFALDRVSGKIVWHNGSMATAARSVPKRINNNAGDPRNYRTALAEDVLMVTSAPEFDSEQAIFSITAYNAQTGARLWQSSKRKDWTLQAAGQIKNTKAASVIGEVFAADGSAFVVTHRPGENDCHLKRFDPSTGKVQWTLRLGAADPLVFQYTNVRRMPQPTLMQRGELLYVLMGNGALIAADITAGQIDWAMHLDTPFGVGPQSNSNRGVVSSQLEAMENPNGSGAMLVHDGLLYVKQHYGKALFALDPITGETAWSTDKLDMDAKLIAVDDKRFYLMDDAVTSFAIDDTHLLLKKNKSPGMPKHAGAIMLNGKITFLGNYRIMMLETEHLDPAGLYKNDDHLGPNGGYLYRFDDLLVCIDQTQITAFKLHPSDN